MILLSKPIIDDIEAHGYKVLTKSEYEQMTKRLEVLERLYEATKRHEEVLSEKCPFYNDYSPEALAWWKQSSERLYAADDDIEAVLKELEAMGNGHPQPKDMA